MEIRERLDFILREALEKVISEGEFTLEEMLEPALERPRDEANGDWASTVALRCAKQLKKSPREIAQQIVGALPPNDMIQSVEIAGPGFINIRLTPATFQNVLHDVFKQKSDYGKGKIPSGQRHVNLEYVSANPTGPMHVGHGRWAALGDSLARIMRHAGYDVFEEFYINDAGSQMDLFGASVACRYRQICGQEVEMAENGYGGGYVIDIARRIFERDGDKWIFASNSEIESAFREMAYGEMLELMKDTLARFGSQFDCWFSERTLYEEDTSGKTAITRALEAMDEKGHVYKHEGATWFKSTTFGDEKDRVLIKENGEYTYFLSDVAYHYNKLGRGYDHFINIWGADHHGYVKRCEAMMDAWGHPGMLEIVLGQLVNLFREGEAVRMSKRTGEMITFKELIDEVGTDSTRYLMLSRSSDQPIDFDIEAAKKKDATNPVYYVQYAHARICSILRKATGDSTESLAADFDMEALSDSLFTEIPNLSCLVDNTEISLSRKISEFGELVSGAARDRAPFRLTHYAQDLAALFHQFYVSCHVLVEDAELQRARLYLVNVTRIVLAKTLSLLGVSAPSHM